MKTWLAYDILNSLPHCWESMPEAKPVKPEYFDELKKLELVTVDETTGAPALTVKGEEFLNFRGDLHQIEYLERPVVLSEDLELEKALELFADYGKKIAKDVDLSLIRIRDYLARHRP